MLKLVIFDLDGVLIETKQIHFDALNQAISKYDKTALIEWNEHLSQYDGLKTQQKLEKLTNEKHLKIEFHEPIWIEKQHITFLKLKDISENERLVEIFQELVKMGLKIA